MTNIERLQQRLNEMPPAQGEAMGPPKPTLFVVHSCCLS